MEWKLQVPSSKHWMKTAKEKKKKYSIIPRKQVRFFRHKRKTLKKKKDIKKVKKKKQKKPPNHSNRVIHASIHNTEFPHPFTIQRGH